VPVSENPSFYLHALARDLFEPLIANRLSKSLVMATPTKLHLLTPSLLNLTLQPL
jgi:hypothetical protein